MTTRPYELLARFASDGTVAGVLVRTITTVSGRDYESDPVPLSGATDTAFTAFALQFSAAAVAERDAEKATHAATKMALTAAETELDAAMSQVTGLQSQVNTIAGLNQQIATLTAEIDRLTAMIPPPIGPRQIYPRELLGRLTFAEVVAAIRTDNDAAIYAVANLQTTVSPVDLDSEETRTLIGALVVAGILTPDRLAEILA